MHHTWRVLETVESEKDVGVMVHQSLKPSLQCTRAAEKNNQVLGQLSRGITRDKQTFLKLYRVYVTPHLEYAVASWCPWQQADKEMLEKVQRSREHGVQLPGQELQGQVAGSWHDHS
jgi:hypothetical protein